MDPAVTKRVAETKSDLAQTPISATELMTRQMSFKRIQRGFPIAAKCLMLCGYLHADFISEEILHKALNIQETEFKKAIDLLKKLKMIEPTATNAIYTIAPQLQEFIRTQDEIELTQARLKLLADVLYNLYPFNADKPTEIAKVKELQPHFEALASHLDAYIIPGKGQIAPLADQQVQIFSVLTYIYASYSKDPRRLIHYAEKAVNVEVQYPGYFYEVKANCYSKAANAHRELGEMSKAIDKYKQCLGIYSIIGETYVMLKVSAVYHDLINIYDNFGDLRQVLATLYKKLEFLQLLPTKSTVDIVRCYQTLGNLHRKLGETKKAVECDEKAWEFYSKFAAATELDKANYLTNLAYSYIVDAQKVNVNKAIELQSKALEIHLRINNSPSNIANAYCNLGLAYCVLGPEQEAVDCFNETFKILETLPQQDTPFVLAIRIEATIGMGNAQRALGNADDAIICHQNALKLIAEKNKSKQYLAQGHYELGQDCLALKQYKEAIWNLGQARMLYYLINPQHPLIAVIESRLEAVIAEEKKDRKRPLEVSATSTPISSPSQSGSSGPDTPSQMSGSSTRTPSPLSIAPRETFFKPEEKVQATKPSAFVYYELGQNLLASRRYQEAICNFEQAKKLYYLIDPLHQAIVLIDKDLEIAKKGETGVNRVFNPILGPF